MGRSNDAITAYRHAINVNPNDPAAHQQLGQLYLNEGTWGKERIISENWVDESTKQRIRVTETWGYGYHWMQESISYRNQIYHSFFHPGYGGQILAVCPELKMVIIIMAGNYDSDSKKVNYDIIRRYIIPAIENAG